VRPVLLLRLDPGGTRKGQRHQVHSVFFGGPRFERYASIDNRCSVSVFAGIAPPYV
jgi:hypothetical protein